MFIYIKNTSKGVKSKTSIVAYCVIDKKKVTNIKNYNYKSPDYEDWTRQASLSNALAVDYIIFGQEPNELNACKLCNWSSLI